MNVGYSLRDATALAYIVAQIGREEDMTPTEYDAYVYPLVNAKHPQPVPINDKVKFIVEQHRSRNAAPQDAATEVLNHLTGKKHPKWLNDAAESANIDLSPQ